MGLPHSVQNPGSAATVAPHVGHSTTDIGFLSFPVRAIVMLEGPQRLAGLAAQRADEGAVVLVGDLACPVVELELLQRRERPVALVQEAQALLLLGIRRDERVTAAGAEERTGDVDDAGGREQRAKSQCERAPSALPHYARATAPSPAKRAASRRCSRASGHMVTTEPSTKIRPESQIRLTSGFTITSRMTDPSG